MLYDLLLIMKICFVFSRLNYAILNSLQVCHSEGDLNKFTTTVNMAKKVLPHQGADIEAIVADYRSKWEANSDIALAGKIIIPKNSVSD